MDLCNRLRSARSASITVRNRYQTADGKAEVSQEIYRMEFRRHAAGILLLWDSTFRTSNGIFILATRKNPVWPFTWPHPSA